MLEKSIKVLMKKGCGETIALLLCWDDLSQERKDSLSFEQCLALLNKVTPGSSDEIEIWEMTRARAETFGQSLAFWKTTPPNSYRRNEAWEDVSAKADTLKQHMCIWEESQTSERGKSLAIVRATAQTLLYG